MNNAFFDWLHDAAERALPVVCAFGLGVLIALHTTEAKIDAAMIAARALAVQVEQVRIACGAQPNPDAVAARMATYSGVQAVQP